MRTFIRSLIFLAQVTTWHCLTLRAAAEGKPELVYKTGFEGTTKVIPFKNGDDELVGNDHSPGCQSDVRRDLGLPNVVIQYTNGDASKRFGKVIAQPGNENNHVLQFWIGDSWFASNNEVKARVQANFYQFKPGYKEFYQSVRLYVHPDFAELRKYPRAIDWLTIAEFWNDKYWDHSKYPMRISFGIGKPGAEVSDLNFIVSAESKFKHWLWRPNNLEAKVPIGHWFTLDYYWKEGDAQTGRFYAAMTPDGGTRQVIYDIAASTSNPEDPAPDGMTDWNPMKLYTSKEVVAFMKDRGKALEVWWDDLELWKNRRPADSTPGALSSELP